MRKRPRILCAADLAAQPAVIARLREVADVDELPPTRNAIEPVIHEYDAYFASLYMRFDRSLIERARKLKVVATPTTGLDHLDIDALEERGIELVSLKYERAFLDTITATAEQAWALLLATVRHVPALFDEVKQGRWSRELMRGHQLSGKTLGILGYGRLGSIVADYGTAFRMRVIACDHLPFEAEGVTRVSFDELLAESDVLSIHVHLTEDNRHLLNASAFGRMKQGVYLVNTSRGGIIDEAALIAALESGKVAGCGLDVIDGEWRDDLIEHPLIQYARAHHNVVISPHVGGATWESQAMALMFTADRLVEALATG